MFYNAKKQSLKLENKLNGLDNNVNELLKLRGEVLSEFGNKVNLNESISDLFPVYSKIERFVEDKSKYIPYSSDNLVDLITVLSLAVGYGSYYHNEDQIGSSDPSIGITYLGEKTGQIIQGMYTGALLSMISRGNQKQGSSGKLILDGHSFKKEFRKKFKLSAKADTNIKCSGNPNIPYLFLFARDFDDLIIKNLNGDYLGAYMASRDGTGYKLEFIGCKGNRIGEGISSEKGKLFNLTGRDCEGDRSFSKGASYNGFIGFMYAQGMKGNNLLYKYGEGGSTPIFILDDIKDELNHPELFADGGKCEIMYIRNSKANNTKNAHKIFRGSVSSDANLNHIIVKNNGDSFMITVSGEYSGAISNWIDDKKEIDKLLDKYDLLCV